MTVGKFPLAEVSISAMETKDGSQKAPPKRTARVIADRQLLPESR